MAMKAYGSTATQAQPCYVTHKVLEVGAGRLYGGRCGNPVVKDAEIYISFDSVTHPSCAHAFPWNPGESFCFPIIDGQAPGDVKEFHAMVCYVAQKLENGAKIHAGCIGGHGRTGLFLAAVVATIESMGKEVYKESDATQYVRDNYCLRAVETQAQVDWLAEFYLVKPVVPYYILRAQARKTTDAAGNLAH